MSSPLYSITIKNESNSTFKFLVIQDISHPTNAPPAKDVFTNVYMTSPPVDSGDGSQVTFTMRPDFFAVYGVSRTPLEAGVRLHTGGFVPISISQQGGTLAWMTAPEGHTRWAKDRFSTIKAAGGFAIRTDTSFRYPNQENIFIGIGAPDPIQPDGAIPVQTFAARPNLLTTFYPSIRYIITTGDYEPGTIVDKSQIGANLVVDFERTNTLKNLVFIYNDQGEFVPDEQTKEAGGFEMRLSEAEVVVLVPGKGSGEIVLTNNLVATL